MAIATAAAWPTASDAQMPLPAPDLPAAAEIPAIATDARLAGDDHQTRLVIDLSRKIDMRAFTLADPYRVVIDVPEVNFQLPPKSGERGRGVIKAFRYGLVMPGGSRIVIDVNGPVRVIKAFVVGPSAGQPARMVVDLTPVDRDTFMRAAAIDNRLRAPELNRAARAMTMPIRPIRVR